MRRAFKLGAALSAVATVVALAPVAPASAAGPRPAFAAPWPCGQVRDYYHHSREVSNAIDYNILGPSDMGTPALATAPGRVTAVRYNGGYGNEVLVDHGGGWVTRVAHLSRFSVSVGQQVARGQEVGKVGSTGNSTGPHLHYEQIADGVRVRIIIDGVAMNYDGRTRQHTSRNCNDPLTGGTYRVRAEVSNHDLDVTDCQTADGADVRIWYRITTSPCQRWQVTDLGNNVFTIIDSNTGKSLDVTGCSTADGAIVQLWPDNGAPCQQWRIEPRGGGAYSVLAVNSGKSLDVAACSNQPGADVIIWPHHGGSCQRWYFDRI